MFHFASLVTERTIIFITIIISTTKIKNGKIVISKIKIIRTKNSRTIKNMPNNSFSKKRIDSFVIRTSS